jgi:hypothetical protein
MLTLKGQYTFVKWHIRPSFVSENTAQNTQLIKSQKVVLVTVLSVKISSAAVTRVSRSFFTEHKMGCSTDEISIVAILEYRSCQRIICHFQY